MKITGVKKIRYAIAALVLSGLSGPGTTMAATGNISDTDKYGWSENTGWANFRPTHGGVTVSSTHLSGFAWLENIGWVKLGDDSGGPYTNTASSNWGVNLDGSGNLSGYGWSETVGWINFNSSHSQVTIDLGSGDFNGYAWGENIGYVHFNNASPAYKVNAVIDSDGDGTPDISDGCPLDPAKIAAGACGCGVADTDTDGDGIADCHDGCPIDSGKTVAGICGCGVSDVDSDSDGTADCNDGCVNDPSKTAEGICGCNVADTDTDSDGTADCNDNCPNDVDKTEPGTCGCGMPDVLNTCGTCGPLPIEVCDGNDNNCDGQVDEGVTNACGSCGSVPVEVCDLIDNDCDGQVDEDCVPATNPINPGDENTPISPLPDGSIDIVFEGTVDTGGDVSVSITEATGNSRPPEETYSVVGKVYDVTFSGTYTGSVELCFSYDDSDVKGNEANLSILHGITTPPFWEKLPTTSHDTVSNIICGLSSSLSPFVIVEPSADTDGDGILDGVDNCPFDSNAGQDDGDSDGVGDICDVFPADPADWFDTDGDGVGDNSDAFPNDPTKWEAEAATSTHVPVHQGLWLVPSILAGLYLLRRRKVKSV